MTFTKGYLLIFVGIIGFVITGCLGTGIDVASDVRQQRKELAKKAEVMWGKYKAVRRLYIDLRDTYRNAKEHYKNNSEDYPDNIQLKAKKMDRILVDIDKELRDFHNHIVKFKRETQKLNSDIKKMEELAEQADSSWNDVVDVMKNITQIGAAIAKTS